MKWSPKPKACLRNSKTSHSFKSSPTTKLAKIADLSRSAFKTSRLTPTVRRGFDRTPKLIEIIDEWSESVTPGFIKELLDEAGLVEDATNIRTGGGSNDVFVRYGNVSDSLKDVLSDVVPNKVRVIDRLSATSMKTRSEIGLASLSS